MSNLLDSPTSHHDAAASVGGPSPGKRARTSSLVVQRRATSGGGDTDAVHRAAEDGTRGAGGPLPFLDRIQQAFGPHDVRGVVAHVDDAAAAGAAAMGAEAFAVGHHVAFAGAPSLHTAAHEAAHVVQQRAGVHLAGGVGAEGDVYERHADEVADRVVRGESAAALLDTMTPGAAPTTSGAVQRIMRIGKGQVQPKDHDQLVARVKAQFEAASVAWTPTHEQTLRGWLTDRTQVITAESIHAIARNLHDHPTDPSQWTQMTTKAISEEDLKKGKHNRQRDRFARLMKPQRTPTAVTVPGLGNLDDSELLRLAHSGHAEQQFWMRSAAKDKTKLDIVKRRGIKARDEAHVTAAGNPARPSYVVSLDNRHLGHFYVGSGRQSGTGNPRTYGSKKDREGYEYKGSGLVDGHAIQVQDDQRILGPYQKDAQAWSTTVSKTDGSTVEYEDASYLPTGPGDARMIETHPHNFYWENQGAGQRMRQKSIEMQRMKDGGSFLHYNHYTGHTFHPNDGKATDHIYHVPSRVDYLSQVPGEQQTHYSVDNRPTADYSNPKGYDKTTHRYPEVPGGVPAHHLNATLGGLGAREHLELAKMPDTSSFPRSTVLSPEDEDFSFTAPWSKEVTDYVEPPPSPYFVPDEFKEKEREADGDLRRRKHFPDKEDDRYLITDASYDEKSKKTKLTRKRRRVGQPSEWQEGDALADHVAQPSNKKQKTEHDEPVAAQPGEPPQTLPVPGSSAGPPVPGASVQPPPFDPFVRPLPFDPFVPPLPFDPFVRPLPMNVSRPSGPTTQPPPPTSMPVPMPAQDSLAPMALDEPHDPQAGQQALGGGSDWLGLPTELFGDPSWLDTLLGEPGLGSSVGAPFAFDAPTTAEPMSHDASPGVPTTAPQPADDPFDFDAVPSPFVFGAEADGLLPDCHWLDFGALH